MKKICILLLLLSLLGACGTKDNASASPLSDQEKEAFRNINQLNLGAE